MSNSLAGIGTSARDPWQVNEWIYVECVGDKYMANGGASNVPNLIVNLFMYL